ncbi:MAG: hypothetical protein ACR2PO_11950 [Methyloligellaceae bacterium]
MAKEHNGTEYRYILASDVVRDGMYIEVSDEPKGTNALIEIFYSDVTHEMTMTLFKPDIPIEVIEWAISVAQKRLPVAKIPDD